MFPRRFRLLLSILLSTFLIVAPLNAQPKKNTAPKIKLVLGIVIDQFRYDYLTRFADQFGEGGFKRLLQGGAVFSNAHYPYTPTVTACGHAAFMSGTSPAYNGIIGNTWFDRATAKSITSVADANTKLLGGKEDATGMSPMQLVGSSLGDQLKFHTAEQAKVIGMSYKDRSAILPVGKHPNGAYWFSLTNGAFVSSTYYFSTLPAWVKKFNQEQNPARYFGKVWERLLPEAAYARSLRDDYPHEKFPTGTKFPHVINGGEPEPGAKFYTHFETTPFANDHLVAFAKAALENEKLGQDDVPDLLTISFSANDLVGHSFGPYSQEVQDITLRTDRTLAELFAYLDQKIGLQNILVAMTADHGVSPIPEHAQEYHLGGRIESKAITEAAEAALDQRFGEEKWILALNNGNIYFDYGALERRKVSREEAERLVSAAIRQIPGIAECFSRTQILTGQLPSTTVARSVAAGFYPARNGDLVIVPQPFYLAGETIVASHGTPYSYDTHIPVIFYGAGIKAGLFTTPSSPLDIAPTLAAILKIEPPSNSIGQILREAMKP
ncbi:MAG TPA: alkaline phosphatase family protein [Blastocatellia bacterium]|nr:alkaline phosphatase family protein [Blastocatellia bacterium]